MKISLFLVLVAGAFSGGYPKIPGNQPIDKLDDAIQRRFAAPPAELGMSRIALPSSFGKHFQPTPNAATDFRPETPAEQSVIRELEASSIKVGFYVFGAAITRFAPEIRDFRALKGPAVITQGTVRGAVPEWGAVYPIAREAMKVFERGGGAFESSAGSWRVLARPVPASSPSCVGCHNNPMIGRASHPVALHDAIGGALYVYQ